MKTFNSLFPSLADMFSWQCGKEPENTTYTLAKSLVNGLFMARDWYRIRVYYTIVLAALCTGINSLVKGSIVPDSWLYSSKIQCTF